MKKLIVNLAAINLIACGGAAQLDEQEPENLGAEYSGDPLYPVPSFDEELTCKQAYHCSPLWSGPYGKARRDLIVYLIQRLEERISCGE